MSDLPISGQVHQMVLCDRRGLGWGTYSKGMERITEDYPVERSSLLGSGIMAVGSGDDWDTTSIQSCTQHADQAGFLVLPIMRVILEVAQNMQLYEQLGDQQQSHERH